MRRYTTTYSCSSSSAYQAVFPVAHLPTRQVTQYHVIMGFNLLGSVKVLISKDDPRDYRGACDGRIDAMVEVLEVQRLRYIIKY